jgi:hypothetical protein
MTIEQQHLRTYRELFIHRQDVFAQQTPKGAYFLKRSPISDDVIRSHLQGEITAGFYALSPDNTARWVCLDADREDGLEQLQEACKQLDQRGIPSQLEGSRRGGHLWVLFEPIAAAEARRLILGALPHLEGVEVFPKQDRVPDGGVGSLVRGPLGIHLLTARRYPFLDPISLQPVAGSVQATLEYLQGVSRVAASQVVQRWAIPEYQSGPAESIKTAGSHSELRPHFVAGEVDRDLKRLSPIQRLKARIGDEYAFISQFVELDEQGRGHCPLHPPDTHPSFVVDRKTGHWSCFHEVDPKTGRYLGGDAIEFYRRLKGLSYKRVITVWDPTVFPEETS